MGSVGNCYDCDDRVVLEPYAGRAARSSVMEDTSRARQRDLRVPRDLPQSTTAALIAWHGLTGGVRITERIMKCTSPVITSPEKPGHTNRSLTSYARPC
jgi:hypothetical protein